MTPLETLMWVRRKQKVSFGLTLEKKNELCGGAVEAIGGRTISRANASGFFQRHLMTFLRSGRRD
jgi:hypothetical protein